MGKRGMKYGIQTILIILIIVILNAIAQRINFFVDLTEEKRFTLTESTESLLKDVDDIVLIDILLEGELASSFQRLKNRTEEIVKQFRSVNPLIEYKFTNPSQGSVEEINQLRQQLSKDGIFPRNLLVTEGTQRVEKLIYPYAIIKYGERKIPVNLLEAIGRGGSEEEALNKSVKLLEFKLSSALNKLFLEEQPVILFTEGNGELREEQTAKLETDLGSTIITGRINIDSIYQIDAEKVDILIVAKPTRKLSTRSKFIIDQYIMSGGNVIWLIDQFHVNLDSINLKSPYVPRPIEHGLDDLFFKYGVRINKDLVLDLENSKIPQVIGMQGGQAQQQLFPWVYHPLLQGNPNSTIVRNIDRVSSTFASSVTPLDNPLELSYTTLLTTSNYSRFQLYPMRLSFDILKLEQRPEAYNKKFLPVAIMVEGEFESLYKNRVTESMTQALNQINASFVEKSKKKSIQVFAGDGDIIKNLFVKGRISPIGFNKWEGITYSGNNEFIMNIIDYILDDYGLMEARTKNVKLRLLDQVKLQEEGFKWQIINLLGPIIFVLLFALIFSYIRKKRFGS
ncbi:MAG: gliding motility-associated ABC transporter substrate-binding protein GldG [Saprospiraceae bacterium]|nr:gliding motility-associated ABC transporter substrate-binding protein GldG [Saprospiraceae bacterium]